jgi:predicted ferric reductase
MMHAPLASNPPSGSMRAPRRLPAARPTRFLETDLLAIVGAFAVCVVGLWIRHGGVTALRGSATSIAESATQITGLVASGVGLAGVALVGRPHAVERHFGLDRMFVWHRILGEMMAVLVGVHIVAGVVAWSGGSGYLGAIKDLTGRTSYMALATVGALLIGLVTISSLASVRRKLSYETWYFIHLSAYFGFAMSFGHQIVQGKIFAHDTVARWLWIVLHIGVIVLLVWRRWGTTVSAALNPLRVAELQQVSPDTVSVRLAGRSLATVEASPGQFFFLRPLRARWWWQTHPFSLSAAPSTAGLRFTIKRRGDGSAAITSLPIGTKVAVEGPYGTCTTDSVGDKKVLFIVGGVGVAPARAMLETMTTANEPIMLFRASNQQDLVHLDEVRSLIARRNGQLRTLVGSSANLAVKDPFSARRLRAAVPDLHERTVIVCGPERLVWAARAGLRAAGVPTSEIHFERPWW